MQANDDDERPKRNIGNAARLFRVAESPEDKRIAAGLSLSAVIGLLEQQGYTEAQTAPLHVLCSALEALNHSRTMPILVPSPQARSGAPLEGALAVAKARAVIAVDELIALGHAKLVKDAIRVVCEHNGMTEGALRDLRKNVSAGNGHNEVRMYMQAGDMVRLGRMFTGEARLNIILFELRRDRLTIEAGISQKREANPVNFTAADVLHGTPQHNEVNHDGNREKR